jgi:hypothetical protein
MSFSYSPKIITDGLVLYLDAANAKSYVSGSTTWRDISRGGNNGTLVNGPTFNTSNGGSIVFDGVDDYVDCDTASSLNDALTGLTVSVWYKVGTKRTEIIAENGTSFTTNTFYIAQEDANNLSFAIANPSGQYQRIFGNTSYTIGTWYNFVGVWSSGSSLLAYINGQDTSQALLSPFGNLISVRSGNSNLFIARRPGGSLYSSGTISQFSIYNRSLTAQEIQQNYNATKTRYGL